jgi:hypothetical protein
MLDLAQLQTQMAQGLLSGSFDGLADIARDGPVGADAAWSIHRNTALHGLVNSLRLTYPTVDALTGAEFFDQAALAFVERHPPAGPWLSGYGASFGDFLAGYDPAAEVPYLADAARLDLAIEAAAQDALNRDGLQFDLGETMLTLDASLRVVRLAWPVHHLRDALDAGDDALAAFEMAACRHDLALWRLPEGAGMRPLAPFAAAVLTALLAGGDIEAALSGGGDPAVLQSQIFSAPFTRLSAQPKAQS